jgi:hypothetical protein
VQLTTEKADRALAALVLMSEGGMSALADEVGIARPNLSAAFKSLYPNKSRAGGKPTSDVAAASGRKLPPQVRKALARRVRLHLALGLPRAVVSWVLRDELHLLQLARGAIEFRPLLRVLPEPEAKWHERANSEQRGAYFDWAWQKAHTPLLEVLKLSEERLDQILQESEDSPDRVVSPAKDSRAAHPAGAEEANASDGGEWWRIPDKGWAPAVLTALRRTVPKQYLLGVARCGAGCQVVLLRAAPERINALTAEYVRRGLVPTALPFVRLREEEVGKLRNVWSRVSVRAGAPDPASRLASAALALDAALAQGVEEESAPDELIEALRTWVSQLSPSGSDPADIAENTNLPRSRALPHAVAAAIFSEWGLEAQSPALGVSGGGERVRVHVVCLPAAGTLDALQLPAEDFAIVTRLVGQAPSRVFELLYAGAVRALREMSSTGTSMLDAKALRLMHSRIEAADRLHERSSTDEGAATMRKRDENKRERRNHDDLEF